MFRMFLKKLYLEDNEFDKRYTLKGMKLVYLMLFLICHG
jgi:hypothetical protein